jgi:archaellin
MIKYIIIIILLIFIVSCSNNKAEDLRVQLIQEQENRVKLTNSIEIISIIGNKQSNMINNFEILIRLDAGSDEFEISDLTINNIKYQSSKLCDFNTITNEFFCVEIKHGNEDSLLENGEVFLLKFKESKSLSFNEKFDFIFNLNDQKISKASITTPESFSTSKIPLWPVG